MIFNRKEKFGWLLKEIEMIAARKSGRDEKLEDICQLLTTHVPYYDWVGFYIVDQVVKNELYLGPFVGEPTEHKRIQFGHGICGQAAERKKTFIIQDVTKEKNYLACSSKVLAEIVVPIFKGEKVVGELDIDSHQFSPFGSEDEQFLEAACDELSKIF